MSEKKFRVTFEPDGRSVYVFPNTTVYEAVHEAGIIIKSDCGGMGVCGKCKVRIMEGDFEQKGSERFISEEDIKKGHVLACRTNILSDMVVEIPISSRLYEQKILTEGVKRELKLAPNVKKVYIKVDKPTLEDQRADLDRIWGSLKKLADKPKITVDVLRRLPDKLRKGNFGITIVLNESEIIGIERDDKTEKNYGLAFDIGTTTVVGYLLNLNTGEQLAVAAKTNPQTGFGDDVISRIQFANTNNDGLETLSERIVTCINEIIDELCDKAGIEKKFIYEITTTGNSTMNHLLLKLNPKYLAQHPYVTVLRSSIDMRAEDIGIHINTYGKLYVMPNIAGFVGGDTVGVILSTDLYKTNDIRFAIDIGTNGELVMGNKDRLVSCSTAAGPAFEGARIIFGMRASDGAIEKVVIDDGGVHINTIGNAKASGICGTGLIDSIAELLKAGIILPSGRMIKKEELPPEKPDFIRDRLLKHEKYGVSFILVSGEESKTGEDILLTQKDIRETQLAKGAILAGYEILKRVLNINDEDITEVLLAGAFGNYIRRDQAIRIGLLPKVPKDKIKFVGNAAGFGAKMVLLSKDMRRDACNISENTEYVELAVRRDFQDIFVGSMGFPEKQY